MKNFIFFLIFLFSFHFFQPAMQSSNKDAMVPDIENGLFYFEYEKGNDSDGEETFSFQRPKADSLIRSKSHPVDLNNLTKDIESHLVMPTHFQHYNAMKRENQQKTPGFRLLARKQAADAERNSRLARETRSRASSGPGLIDLVTEEPGEVLTGHQRRIEHLLGTTAMLARQADERAVQARDRARYSAKLAIAIGAVQGSATVIGWMWSAGMIQRWMNIEE